MAPELSPAPPLQRFRNAVRHLDAAVGFRLRNVPAADERLIATSLQEGQPEMNELFSYVSKLLSRLSKHMGVVVSPLIAKVRLRDIEFVRLAPRRVLVIGSRDKVSVPNDAVVVDVTGKTIIPGLINAHGHVGDVKGIDGGHYSAENIVENLSIYARYGITTVVSLGGDKIDSEPLRAAHDSATTQRARLFIAGDVISGNTPEEKFRLIVPIP